MAQAPLRKLITDRIWNSLEEAVQSAKHSAAGAPPAMSDREFIAALFYLNRAGCPWRDLSSPLGYWHALYMRFRRWKERSVLQRLWRQLQAQRFAQACELLMGSTAVRAHQHAADAPKKRRRSGSGMLLGQVEHEDPSGRRG